MNPRICRHPFCYRAMTEEDVAAVIRKVADGDAECAIIESDEYDFMQFVVEAPDSIYLEQRADGSRPRC